MRALLDARLHRGAAWLRRFGQEHWKRALIGVHVFKLCVWFSRVDLFSGFPLTSVDYVQYYARVLRIHHFLDTKGRIWGYDPFEMAGYISGPFHEVGVHLLALAAYVLSPVLSVEKSLLFLEIAGLSLAPFLLLRTVRNFGGTSDQGWLAFGMSVFLFAGLEQFSMTLLPLGLWGYMIASYFAAWQASEVWAWCEKPNRASWLGMTASSLLVFQVHPSALTVTLVPNVMAFLLHARRLRPLHYPALIGAVALALAGNLYWILPFLQFSHWRDVAPYFVTGGVSELVAEFNPVQKRLYGFVVVLTQAYFVAGVAACIRRRKKSQAVFFATWWLALFVLSFFGSDLPTANTLQPGRTKFPLWLLTWVIVSLQFREWFWSSPRRRALTATVAAFALVFSVPGALPRSFNMSTQLSSDLPADQEKVVAYLRVRNDLKGRVLLECNDSLVPNFNDILPHLTGRAMLGGPHAGNFLTARFTVFAGERVTGRQWESDRPIAFGRELRSFSEEDFDRYLELYNVQLVGARSKTSVSILDNFGGILEPVEKIGNYAFYERRKKGSWFHQGSGRISFNYDKIEVTDPSTGGLVVRFHYLSTLRSEPPVRLTPVRLMDDPVPFIGIDNAQGHRRIVLTNP